MRHATPLLLSSMLAASGCTIDFDRHFEGSGGGAGTGATTSVGGGGGDGGSGGGPSCPGGCLDGGTCVAGDTVDVCRIDGQNACASCDDANPCTQDSCGDGACTHDPITGPCPGGICMGTTCTPLAEDCTNGVDDNDDMLVDCADPICTTTAGYACVTAPPPASGWLGPAAIYLGTPGQSCLGAYDSPAYNGGTSLNAPSATCSTCTCAPAPTCSPSYLTIERKDPTNMSCDGTCEFTWPIPANNCSNLSAQANNDPCGKGTSSWFNWTYSTLGEGTCTPSLQSPTVPPATWTQQATVCVAAQISSGGCMAGQACAAPTSPPLATPLCIYKQADVPCDQSAYPNRTLAYGTIQDTRGCTACNCNTPSCAGTMRIYDMANCGNQVDYGPAGAQVCGQIGQIPASQFSAYYELDTDALTCVANPSSPTGSATPATPVTICCQ